MANIALEEKLESEFGDFGIDIEGNLVVLGKCKSLFDFATNEIMSSKSESTFEAECRNFNVYVVATVCDVR